MIYPWLKALHVAAAMTWIGGLLASAVVLAALLGSPDRSSPIVARLQRAARTWDRRVTSPAMLLTWALGISMAVQAGWFASTWLGIKLLLVLALAALHGMLSGTMRRLAGEPNRVPPFLVRHSAPATVLAAAAIAALVVVKPF